MPAYLVLLKLLLRNWQSEHLQAFHICSLGFSNLIICFSYLITSYIKLAPQPWDT